MKYYILENKVPKEVSVHERARQFGSQKRRVRSSQIGEFTVSTVFLWLDHNYSWIWEPILFETMVFWPWIEEYQERCSTYEQALKMHKKALSHFRIVEK